MKVFVRNNWIKILFFVIFFITSLDSFNGFFAQKVLKHIDEVLVIAMTLYVLANIKYALRKRVLLGLWVAFMALGGISSVVFRYQDLFPALVDAGLICNKFVVSYLSAYVYSCKQQKKVSDSIEVIAKVITVSLFVIAIHDIFLDPWFPKCDYRYFMYTLQLMFSHPTYLAAAASFLLIYFGTRNQKNEQYIYMLMASMLSLFTLRGKAIGFVAIYWMIYLCIRVFKIRRYGGLLALGGVAGVVIAWNQFTQYFLTTGYSPRQIMLKDSLQLAVKHFPLGTGFGTYGSSIAAKYYSPLYVELGYSDNYGMSPDNASFLSDGFWSTIVAQFGFIGLLLFGAVICYLLWLAWKKLAVDQNRGFGMLAILINLVINSFAESSFFNPTCVLLFMLFAACETEV